MHKIFAVEYHYITDQDEAMATVRPNHRAFNAQLAERDLLLAAGPYVGTHDALIIVRASTPQAALDLLADDPFNKAGYIASRLAHEWDPVIGVLK